MSMIQTEKGTKKFTNKEKLAILKEAEVAGVKQTLAKYSQYPATFYYWKRKLADGGPEALQHGFTKERLKEIRNLKKENSTLKELLAEKELESKLKDEMLQKNIHI